MNISNLLSVLDPGALAPPPAAAGGQAQATSASQPAGDGAAQASSGQASSQPASLQQAQAAQQAQQAQSAQANAPSPAALHKAVQKINQQLALSSGITLSAGLDTSGNHPGQVLVELSDKVTKQTFFKYYVPASQVVNAAQNLGGGGSAVPQGTLIHAKA